MDPLHLGSSGPISPDLTALFSHSNGVWTVEIIPAEIQPPARSVAGASGNRIRIGSKRVTNGGDETDLVVAFNEQVLLARHRLAALAPDATLLVEDKWATDENPDIREAWKAAMCSRMSSGVPMPLALRTIPDGSTWAVTPALPLSPSM